MVRILLDAFAASPSPTPAQPQPQPHSAEPQIECVHVNFQLSSSVEDIGRRPWLKLALAFRFCLQAIFARYRHRANILFYIPAPGLRNALYRDWLVMLCCRPFFKHIVFWWQAAGLGAWLNSEARAWERRVTRLLLHHPDLSIVMGSETEADAFALGSKHTAVVPNAIPDPCPKDAQSLIRNKAQRRTNLARLLVPQNPTSLDPTQTSSRLRLLFISLCHREKGLFDTLEAVALANRYLATSGTPLRVTLDVAGRFYFPSEQTEFENRIRQPDLQLPGEQGDSAASHSLPAIQYHGFADGPLKDQLFREADALVFPTYYAAESFGLVLLEAMAYGLDIITTQWRNIPELLPDHFPGLVQPKDPAGLSKAIIHLCSHYDGARLRRHYETMHSIHHFRHKIASALGSDLDI